MFPVQIGAESNLDISLVEAGKIKVALKYEGVGADAELAIFLDSDYFLDKIAAAIPGNIDDAIIAMIKSMLKK